MGLLSSFSQAMDDPRNRQILGAGLMDMSAGFSGQRQGHVNQALNRQQRADETKARRAYEELRMQELVAGRARKEEERMRQEEAMQQLGGFLSPQEQAWMQAGYGQQIADQQIANLYGGGTQNTAFGKIDPSKYTQASVRAFEQSGRYSDLAMPKAGAAPEVSDKDLFGRENTLRDDFRTETRDFMSTQNQYSILKDSPETGIGDVGRVFALMKMYDPGSTVREGEQATAQNAAGVPSWVASKWNHLIGGGTLDPKARAEMLEAGSNVYQKSYADYESIASRYTSTAERYGLDPANIGQMDLMNLYQPQQPQQPQQAAPQRAPGSVIDPDVNKGFQAYYDALPSGAQYSAPDGTVRIKP